MFRKIVDVLKEVFWIKPSRQKAKSTRRKTVKKSLVKKKSAKKPVKPVTMPAVRLSLKPKAMPVPKALAVKKQPKSSAKSIDPSLTEVGEITHYFERIKVCVVKITQGTVLIGDKLNIQGVKTKFIQKVWSMQIESEDVKIAKKGQLIGLKVDKLVAVGDKVYK